MDRAEADDDAFSGGGARANPNGLLLPLRILLLFDDTGASTGDAAGLASCGDTRGDPLPLPMLSRLDWRLAARGEPMPPKNGLMLACEAPEEEEESASAVPLTLTGAR